MTGPHERKVSVVIPRNKMTIYDRISEHQQKGIPVILITVVSKKGDGPVEIGKKMLLSSDGGAYGTVGGGALEYEAIEMGKVLLKEKRSHLERYVLNEGKIVEEATTLPMACGGVVELFYDYIGSNQVIIFGGGHVGKALVHILKTLNFDITIIDEREGMLDDLEGAHRRFTMEYIDYLEQEGIQEGSYVLICSPSHKFDFVIMHHILSKQYKPKYIGMLCSKVKLADFLKRTYDAFGDEVDLSNFYSPLGLDTGGGSPAEIAVSIAAEMLAVEYKKEGHRHMRLVKPE